MAWGAIAAAAISAAGSYASSENASSGGSRAVSIPEYLRPTARARRDRINELYDNPVNWPQYPTALPASPVNPWEMAAIQGYGDLGDSAIGLGQDYLSSIYSGMTTNPNTLYSAGFSNAPTMWDAAAQQGPGQISPFAVNAQGITPDAVNTYGVGGVNPFLGMYGSTAGITADPNQAINEMLSGQVDNRFTDSLDAAFERQNRNFTERLLPQLGVLDDQFTGGQGGSGGLKVAQRALEDLSQQQTEMSTQAGYSAYLDALDRRDQGAGLATSARLSQSGQDLQGGQLGQALAGLDLDARVGDRNAFLQAALANQGVGFNAQQSNQQAFLDAALANQGADLSAQGMNQDAYLNYLGALTDAGRAGGAASQAATAADIAYLGQIPNAYNVFAGAPNAWQTAGGMLRGVTDPFYANAFEAEQYNNWLPFNMSTAHGDAFNQLLTGSMGGGTVQRASGSNPWMSAALGGISGYMGYGQPNQIPQGMTQQGPGGFGGGMFGGGGG